MNPKLLTIRSRPSTTTTASNEKTGIASPPPPSPPLPSISSLPHFPPKKSEAKNIKLEADDSSSGGPQQIELDSSDHASCDLPLQEVDIDYNTEERLRYSKLQLPSPALISHFLGSFSKHYGIFYGFIPESLLIHIFNKAYGPTVTQRYLARSGSLRTQSTTHEDYPEYLTRAEYGLLSLAGAVGAQCAEDLHEGMLLSRSGIICLRNKTPENSNPRHPGPQDISVLVSQIAADFESVKKSIPQLQKGNYNTLLTIISLGLTAIYLIFEKSAFARRYLDRALHLSILQKEHMSGPMQHGGEAKESSKGLGGDLEAWSRVWRSLVFIDGWVSASIGLSSSTLSATSVPATSDPNGYLDGIDTLDSRKIDQGLHAEMAKLGALMSAITQQVCAPAAVDMTAVREYNEHLKTWHDNLPESLKLQEALEFRPDSVHRTSILLTHCAYLSSLILLTRRVLIAHSKSLLGQLHRHTIYNATEQDIIRFSNDCIYAARQLATVVGIFYMEGRLTRKCWLGIQSAYTSCLIIFLELAYSRHQHGNLPQPADMELISRCICALEYCAEVDEVARAYLTALIPIRDVLFPGLAAGISAGHFQFQQPQQPQPQRRPSLGQRSSSFSHSSDSQNDLHRNSYSVRQESASPNKRPRILAHSSSSGASSGRSGSDSSQSLAISQPFAHPYATAPPMRFTSISSPTPLQQIFTPSPFDSVSGGGGGGGLPLGAAPAIGEGEVNVKYLITHILDNIEHPYGGDNNVISDDALNSANDPAYAYSRFLNPNPPKLSEVYSIPADDQNTSVPFFLYNATTPHSQLEDGQYQSNFIPNPLENPLQFHQPQQQQQQQLQAQPQPQPSEQIAPAHFEFAVPAPKKSQQQTRSIHTTRLHRSHTTMTASHSSLALGNPPGSLFHSAPPMQFSRSSSTRSSVVMLDNTKSVATPGGPLPDVRSTEYEDDSTDGSGRRRKMPFKSLEEFESFLRRVA